MDDILELSKRCQISDINSIYQGYLSRDYTISDNKIVFDGGKIIGMC